jgi:hypothetical protein
MLRTDGGEGRPTLSCLLCGWLVAITPLDRAYLAIEDEETYSLAAAAVVHIILRHPGEYHGATRYDAEARMAELAGVWGDEFGAIREMALVGRAVAP